MSRTAKGILTELFPFRAGPRDHVLTPHRICADQKERDRHQNSEAKPNGDVTLLATGAGGPTSVVSFKEHPDAGGALGQAAGDGSSATSQVHITTSGSTRRRRSGYGHAISSDSTAKMRCRQRKLLFIKRNKICDLTLVMALLGIGLIVLDSELTAPVRSDDVAHQQRDGTSRRNGSTAADCWGKNRPETLYLHKNDAASMAIRGLAVIFSLLLCVCVFLYHSIEIKIALIDSGADDWRVALTGERTVKLMLEMLVCIICPLPGTGYFTWCYINQETGVPEPKCVPVDVLLSVPMFCRAYLLCRFMVLHSKQFQDAATRSIAALNRISMDFRFVIKTMMSDHPLRVLIVFTVSYWICMSWMFTQCERHDAKLKSEHTYLNSIWFIMVTFMSIGYGDIVPHTYCGRGLSIATGIVGAGVSSALIAVISRKLELSRAEKHVNNFMADSRLTNQRKNAAASVLQHTWFIHKYKTSAAKSKGDDLRLRTHQRRFLQAINDFRRIKWDQRRLAEKGNSLLDIGKMHNEMNETLWEMHRTQDQLIGQVDFLTQKIVELQLMLVNAQQLQPRALIRGPETSAAALAEEPNSGSVAPNRLSGGHWSRAQCSLDSTCSDASLQVPVVVPK